MTLSALATISEDGMCRRTCPTAIVAIAALVIATTSIAISTVVIVALTKNGTILLATVTPNLAAFRSSNHAIGAIHAPLLTNLALIITQLPRFSSG